MTAQASVSHTKELLNIDVSWKKPSSQTVPIWAPDDCVGRKRIFPWRAFSCGLLLWAKGDEGSANAKVLSGAAGLGSSPWGVAGQGWAARARPATQSGADRVREGSPVHWAPPWGQAEARLGRGPMGRPGTAGQGCGELETGTAVASLGQGLTALGADMGSQAAGQVGGAPRGLSRTCKTCGCPQGLDRPRVEAGVRRRAKPGPAAGVRLKTGCETTMQSVKRFLPCELVHVGYSAGGAKA